MDSLASVPAMVFSMIGGMYHNIAPNINFAHSLKSLHLHPSKITMEDLIDFFVVFGQIDRLSITSNLSAWYLGSFYSFFRSLIKAVHFLSHSWKTQIWSVFLPDNGHIWWRRLIEEEAFAGAAFEAVIIPEGCTSIDSRAFADCPNLVYVRIPASVTSVAEDASEIAKCGSVSRRFRFLW